MTVDQSPVQPTRRWLRRSLRPLALAVVALLFVIGGASWLNSRAFGELLNAVEAGEDVLEGYNAGVRVLAGSVRADSPNEDISRAVRRGSQIADEALEGLLVERQRVRDVRIWPWDTDANRARDRYLEHLAAWERQLRSDAKLEQTNESAAISATFTLVNEALAEAVPLIDGDYEGRVEAIASG